jgi:Zinc dependent phospholipase C.
VERMDHVIERTYGRVFKYLLIAANPFKKVVIKTECVIHKYINEQALIILKNDAHLDAYWFFSRNIDKLNEGVVWADQDFKSSSHFFNPNKERGLYGSLNAMTLGVDYYKNAVEFYEKGDINRSMFYLGAAVHLVQDMTVPQHANIRLLDNHRQYENFIKRTYLNTPRFLADRGGYYGDDIPEYIRCNARCAIKIFNKLKDIDDNKKRYYTIAKFTLPLAQKSTAGCLLTFYKDCVTKHSYKRKAI